MESSKTDEIQVNLHHKLLQTILLTCRRQLKLWPNSLHDLHEAIGRLNRPCIPLRILRVECNLKLSILQGVIPIEYEDHLQNSKIMWNTNRFSLRLSITELIFSRRRAIYWHMLCCISNLIIISEQVTNFGIIRILKYDLTRKGPNLSAETHLTQIANVDLSVLHWIKVRARSSGPEMSVKL